MRPERYRERCDRLREELRSASLDALVVANAANARYLTGFTGSSCLVVITQDGATLFTDFRYRAQAEVEVGPRVRVELVPRDLWGAARRHLHDAGVAVAGYEPDGVPFAEHERCRTSTAPPFRTVPRIVERLRASKDPDELEAIRRAVAIAEEALAATLADIAVGMREIDVAARLESALRVRGSEWHPFPTIAASGPRAALPHAGTTERAIGAGEWLLLDFGARWDGYCADITRTYIVGGRADDRQRLTYELVREAQHRAVSSVRAGMTGADADALARSVIEARGFGDAFGHSLGHGLGLDVHEDPRLGTGADTPLPAGAVVTIEPGLYFPGWGGVRIEDDVHLTPSGGERLSTLSSELTELV